MRHHITGSLEDLSVRELLELLIGDELRRRLSLMHRTNEELLSLYQADLRLRVRSAKNLGEARRVLRLFMDYLGSLPPNKDSARSFLAQYADKESSTIAKYAGFIKPFMKWYGEPITDLTVKVPKTLPPYVKGQDIDKLAEAMADK